MKNQLVRKMTTSAMFAALAFALTLAFHFIGIRFVAQVPFLSYDPKDIIICIGGFVLGPIYALVISVVVSLIEMITISSTGFYGFIMNVVSTCSLVIPAALFYIYKKSFAGALISLLIGFVSEIIMMTMWNIIITPIYMGVEREMLIKSYLWPIVLFNILKCGINVAMVLILYKSIITGLRAIGLVDKSAAKMNAKGTLIMVGLGVLLTGVMIAIIFIVK